MHACNTSCNPRMHFGLAFCSELWVGKCQNYLCCRTEFWGLWVTLKRCVGCCTSCDGRNVDVVVAVILAVVVVVVVLVSVAFVGCGL